jgi:hypothetical protein
MTSHDKPHKPRPYWHVDLKWLFSLLTIITLSVAAFTFGLYRVSDREPAVTILTTAFEAFAGPAASEDTTIAQLAVDFYEQGPSIINSLTSDPETQQVLHSQLGLFGIFTKDIHEGLLTPLIIWSVLAVIFMALAILFSRRFGRLITAAVLTWIIAIPGYTLFLLFRETASGYQTAATGSGDPITGVIGDIVGQMVASFKPIYLVLFWLGALCVLAAIIGKIIWKVRQPKRA